MEFWLLKTYTTSVLWVSKVLLDSVLGVLLQTITATLWNKSADNPNYVTSAIFVWRHMSLTCSDEKQGKWAWHQLFYFFSTSLTFVHLYPDKLLNVAFVSQDQKSTIIVSSLQIRSLIFFSLCELRFLYLSTIVKNVKISVILGSYMWENNYFTTALLPYYANKMWLISGYNPTCLHLQRD